MNEFIEQFLVEARELVEQATDDLLALEQGAEGAGRVDSLFRAFHTLKGAAGIVEFAPMGRALHAAESVLAEVRSGGKPISPDIINGCLACLDQITRWLDQMQASGAAPEDADRAADEIIGAFASAQRVAPVDKPVSPEHVLDWLDALRDSHRDQLPECRTALCYRPDSDAFFRGEDPLALIANIPDIAALDLGWQKQVVVADMDPFACVIEIAVLTKASPDQVRTALESVIDQVEIVELDGRSGAERLSPKARLLLEAQMVLLQEAGTEGKLGRLASAGRVAANVLRHAGLAGDASDVEAASAKSQIDGDPSRLRAAIADALVPSLPIAASGADGEIKSRPAGAAHALRVDMARIDALVNLTGELTVVKNAFGHMVAVAQTDHDPASLAADLREQQQRFDRLVGELQRAVLRIRVLPMRQVFQRFPRQVREIATSVGKAVKFVTEGDATEADATIVESLFEPLLHVLRNAADHGIETPSRRAERGKPPVATIVLRARRQLENVIVEVEDDGGGIDVDRVRQTAATRNLVSPDVLAAMSEAEIINLIFLPGFSTASKITDLSGRGVGMDSVKAAVERLSGDVGIESRAGQGTLVRLRLPFTVMMTRVMTVETAGQVFGLPLDTVVETAMVRRDHVVAMGAGRAFVLRDRTVPLIDLAESLGLSQRRTGSDAKVVVTSAAGQLGGIEVEKLGERMDVMLKPMDGLLTGLRGVAGTTLLGDGRVLIVLDILELFQ